MRKKAASEASSFSSVVRAIRPARDRDDEAGDQAAGGHGEQVEARRAGSRPRRRAGSHAPWRRRSGSCGAASGTRRSAPAPSASASVPDQRAAHELELGERARSRAVVRGAMTIQAAAAHGIPPRARRRPRTCGAPSAGSPASAPRRSRPRPPARAPAAASRGNSPCTRSRSCSAASTVRFSPCQRRTRSSRSADGLGVDGVERLVEHDHARVLQQQAREQHALHLPAGQRADRRGPRSRSGRRPRSPARSVSRVLAADAAEQAGAAPQAHRHHVVDVDRETCGRSRRPAADRRCRCGRSPSRSMRPASGLITPTMPLNSVDLPAPFGPTTAISAPRSTAPSR